MPDDEKDQWLQHPMIGVPARCFSAAASGPAPVPYPNEASATSSEPGSSLASQGASQVIQQLRFEQKRLQDKLGVPRSYPGREEDEARLAQINTELGGRTQSSSPAVAAPACAPPAKAPPPKARLTRLGMTGVQYDFGRPLAEAEVARILFADGKVPDEATLKQGPGQNSWTLTSPDVDSWQATLNKMRARRQTVTRSKPNDSGGAWNPTAPDEVTEEWDIPLNPPSGPKRRDLNNDLGFRITKHYPLDEGKAPVKHLNSIVGQGHGYEIVFDQPVTKDQAMERLFDKERIGMGTVQLIAVPIEPAKMWEVHVISVDAATAWKGPAGDAVGDAITNTPDSIPRSCLPQSAPCLRTSNSGRMPSNIHPIFLSGNRMATSCAW
jgi:hypothetical protein